MPAGLSPQLKGFLAVLFVGFACRMLSVYIAEFTALILMLLGAAVFIKPPPKERLRDVLYWWVAFRWLGDVFDSLKEKEKREGEDLGYFSRKLVSGLLAVGTLVNSVTRNARAYEIVNGSMQCAKNLSCFPFIHVYMVPLLPPHDFVQCDRKINIFFIGLMGYWFIIPVLLLQPEPWKLFAIYHHASEECKKKRS